MHHVLRLCALSLVFMLPSTCCFCLSSDSKSYTVSFIIPETVRQESDPKAISSKQQLISEQTEIRSGQLVKIVSIVVP